MTTTTTVQHWHAIDNGDGGSTIKDEHGGLVAFVQWRGNAPLAAAAPALLDALLDVLLVVSMDAPLEGSLLAGAVAEAREAIAQARGESA